jgi:hypothetical protein
MYCPSVLVLAEGACRAPGAKTRTKRRYHPLAAQTVWNLMCVGWQGSPGLEAVQVLEIKKFLTNTSILFINFCKRFMQPVAYFNFWAFWMHWGRHSSMYLGMKF